MRALPSTRRAYMYVCNIHTCMCVCVCVCVCVYACVYIYPYTHTHAYIHAYMRMRAHTRTHGTCTCTAARVVQPHALHVIILSKFFPGFSEASVVETPSLVGLRTIIIIQRQHLPRPRSSCDSISRKNKDKYRGNSSPATPVTLQERGEREREFFIEEGNRAWK